MFCAAHVLGVTTPNSGGAGGVQTTDSTHGGSDASTLSPPGVHMTTRRPMAETGRPSRVRCLPEVRRRPHSFSAAMSEVAPSHATPQTAAAMTVSQTPTVTRRRPFFSQPIGFAMTVSLPAGMDPPQRQSTPIALTAGPLFSLAIDLPSSISPAPETGEAHIPGDHRHSPGLSPSFNAAMKSMLSIVNELRYGPRHHDDDSPKVTARPSLSAWPPELRNPRRASPSRRARRTTIRHPRTERGRASLRLAMDDPQPRAAEPNASARQDFCDNQGWSARASLSLSTRP